MDYEGLCIESMDYEELCIEAKKRLLRELGRKPTSMEVSEWVLDYLSSFIGCYVK